MNSFDSIEKDFSKELKEMRMYFGGEAMYISKSLDESGRIFTFYIIGSHRQIADLKNYAPGITSSKKGDILTLSDFAQWLTGRHMKALCIAESKKCIKGAKYFNSILKKAGLLIDENDIDFITFLYEPQKICDALEISYNECCEIILDTYNEILSNKSLA